MSVGFVQVDSALVFEVVKHLIEESLNSAQAWLLEN
jgi:hypothetical protein